ncbi:MAG: ROK family protein [Flavobacteriales bacterium]
MNLGIDVGGTSIKAGVVDTQGNISGIQKFASDEWATSPEPFLQLLEKICSAAIKEHAIKGVGIGLPGQLSRDRKSIVALTNLPALNGMAVKSDLQKLFPQLKIALENDARCAAMAEMHFGAHGEKDFLLITLGTGVGGGLVIDGKLFMGANGNPTEVGMIPVGLGAFLEDYIGNKHIVAFTQELLKEHTTSSLKNKEDLSVADIYEAAKAGDACALAVFNFVGSRLGEAMLSMIHLYDVSTLIIGGGIGAAFDLLKPPVMEVLNKRLLPYYTKNLKVLPASLHNESGIVGAASLVH